MRVEKPLIDDSPIYFDDLKKGDCYTTPGRTISEADIVNFAGLSADYNSLHVDAEAASQSAFGQRIAHGLLILAVTSGLTTRLPLILRMSSTMMGLVNLECRWRAPTFIGDTIRVKVTVKDVTPTSKPDRGIVVLERNAVNQRQETVMESFWKIMVRRRPI